MPNASAKLLLLLSAITYSGWHYWTAYQQTADHPDATERRHALASIAIIMTLALAANGLAVLQAVYVEYIYTFQAMEIETLFFSTANWPLWRQQGAVIMGTAVLYEIVRRALKTPLQPNDTPRIASLRVQISMYQRLFREHLLALIGVGTVFGVLGSFSIAGLLATELGLMWLGTWLILRYLTKTSA